MAYARRHKSGSYRFCDSLKGPILIVCLRGIDDIDEGLLHLEVAAFRRCVEQAMDNGRLWDVERYCRFIADSLVNADGALDNAIAVSFIEDFALGDITDLRKKAVLERMPRELREQIIAIDDRWR